MKLTFDECGKKFSIKQDMLKESYLGAMITETSCYCPKCREKYFACIQNAKCRRLQRKIEKLREVIYILWYAYYNSKCNRKCIMWQYSESGKVNGINTNSVDMNYYMGDKINSSTTNKIKKEDVKVENIVVYDNNIDKRAAEYLADYLQCPTIDSKIKFDYKTVKNVYAVGGSKSNYTSYLKTFITGKDRFDTIINVLKFMKKI